MKLNQIIILAIFCLLSSNKTAHCDSGPSYDETVALIKETMSSSTSSYRQESYGYIKLDRCNLEYEVAGKYPVGSFYDIKYSAIDLSSINPQESKFSHDYTAFLVLSFNKYLHYSTSSGSLKIKTIVINTSDDEAARKLYTAFLHLGDLCRQGARDSSQ